MGRPPLFNSEELEKHIKDYLIHCEQTDAVISQKGFCLWKDISHDWLTEQRNNPMFAESIKKLKNRSETYLTDKALKNEVNPTMAIFLLKNNHGMTDKAEVNQNNHHSGTISLDTLADDLRKVMQEKAK